MEVEEKWSPEEEEFGNHFVIL